MKKLATKNLLLLIVGGLLCLFASVKPTFSQQTPNSIPESDAERRVRLVEALERAQSEVRSSRQYIDGLREQIKSKEKLIENLNARDAQQEKIKASLESEITNLRSAITEQKTALDAQKKQVELLQKDLEKTRKKLKRSWQREKMLSAAAAGLLIFILLK